MWLTLTVVLFNPESKFPLWNRWRTLATNWGLQREHACVPFPVCDFRTWVASNKPHYKCGIISILWGPSIGLSYGPMNSSLPLFALAPRPVHNRCIYFFYADINIKHSWNKILLNNTNNYIYTLLLLLIVFVITLNRNSNISDEIYCISSD